MSTTPLRFKKSRYSGSQSNCVEVAHTLTHLRDSKHLDHAALLAADVRALLNAVRAGQLS